MKICSLLPSGTEILFALGLGNQVAAVTQFCDYPPEAKTRPIVSRARVDTSVLGAREAAEITNSLAESGEGTYMFDTDWLRREKPDLILTQDLCHVCDLDASEVAKAVTSFEPEPALLILSPKNLADILNNILRVGKATASLSKARELVHQIQRRMEDIACRAAAERKPRVFILEWIDPLAAGGHWFPELVSLAGGTDELGRAGEPSVLLRWEEIVRYDPEIIIITPCSCTIERTLRDVRILAELDGWWDIAAVQGGEVYIAIPDYFTRPGPRILQGLEITAQIIHPELFSNLIPAGTVVKLDPAARDHGSERLAGFFYSYPEQSHL